MNKNKLITALRAAASALDNKTFGYDWNSLAACNCGVLVCALLGKSRAELKSHLADLNEYHWSDFSWERAVGLHCPVTGAPHHQLFKTLFEFGLTPTDIVHLENLSDPVVLAKMGYPKIERRFFGLHEYEVLPNKKSDSAAAQYMRAWADLLTEEQNLDTPQTKQQDLCPEKSSFSLS